jgi:hypothetical protein
VEYPEIPVAYPSVWQQVNGVADWTDVDLVILNGGINDVSLTRMLNPRISAEQIGQLTQQFCLGEMSKLLPVAAGKLVKAGARIAVLGYYPVMSPQSFGQKNARQAQQVRTLLEAHGVATSSAALGTSAGAEDLLPAIVANCMKFWDVSTTSLQAAVAQTNEQMGRDVCVFVAVPFTEVNALWAPEPRLWELSPFLDAEDEVKALRDRACEEKYGDLVHLAPWTVCDRASVGHPNVQGAADIAAALAAAL